MRKFAVLLSIVLGLSASLVFVSAPAHAMLSSTSSKCASLVVIGARGSGEPVSSTGNINGFGTPGSATIRNALSRIQRTGSVRFRGLNSTEYPAVRVDWTTSFNRGPYWDSVKKGAYATMSIAKDIAASCASSKIALVGYSQGASVMRWAIRDLPDNVKDRVVLVGLIGDPQRRGFNQTTPEIGHHVFFTNETMTGSGVFGPGPVLPSRRRSAMVIACHAKDDICNMAGLWSVSEHGNFYQSSTGASLTGAGFYVALSNNGFR